MPNAQDLAKILQRIDGRGYKAYKDIRGVYDFGELTLFIDHVQGDPFAAPSKVRVRIPQTVAQLPEDLFSNAVRRIALEDFLARQIHAALVPHARHRHGSGKSGLITIDAGGQEVLQRTAVVVTPDWVEARIEVGLPADGHRVMGDEAEQILCERLPDIAAEGLAWQYLDQQQARPFVDCIENQQHLRTQLREHHLVAFIRDGSILPRESGASDRPMRQKNAVPFQAPVRHRVELDVLNPVDGETTVTGMGISEGVTLIVGGGYHGKSTLLQAIERCVYPHIPGDGREYIVTTRDAVKIRAEDGRRVESVDISAFINNLPFRANTKAFCSDDASGSTSQAANIVEALECGCTTLLLDEDTSATNFMVRDARMQALVNKEFEPITPYVDRVRELWERHGVSTILVMGGCGDYFEAADNVIMMRDYKPYDATGDARAIANTHTSHRQSEAPKPIREVRERIPIAASFDASRGRREVKIDVKSVDRIVYGRTLIDLRGAEQLVDLSQTRAVGHAIHHASEKLMNGQSTLCEVLDTLETGFDAKGLDSLSPFHHPGEHPGNYARPRRYEIAAAINRLRTVRMKPQD